MSRPFSLLIFTCLENDGITQDIKLSNQFLFPPVTITVFALTKMNQQIFSFNQRNVSIRFFRKKELTMENAWMGHADRAAPTELISVTNCFLYMREREGEGR